MVKKTSHATVPLKGSLMSPLQNFVAPTSKLLPAALLVVNGLKQMFGSIRASFVYLSISKECFGCVFHLRDSAMLQV
jgi:hypothetical protein